MIKSAKKSSHQANLINHGSDNMKQGWEHKKLKDVCEKITDGTHQTPKYFDRGYIFLSSKNVTSGKIDWNDVKYIDEVQHIEMQKRVSPKKGDILLAKNGTTGVAAIVDKDVDFDIYVSLAWLRSKGEVLPEFLLHFINSPNAKSQFNKRLKGIGVPNLHLEEIREVEIVYPKSLPEQQRIVSVLDAAFAAIAKAKANAEQNLKNARELFESYLQGVFEKKGEGWEERTIGEIGNPKMCKRIFKDQTTIIGDIPFFKIGTFGKEPDAFIPKEIYNEFRAKYSFPKKGDVLISASGTIGRRVRYDGEPAYFQDSNIVWIENDEKQVSNDFLFEFYGACNWASTKGATISRLYNDNLKSIKISFPKSKEAQHTIVRQLDALRAETQKLEAVYQKKIADLEELKKSILQKAFAGELRIEKVETV